VVKAHTWGTSSRPITTTRTGPANDWNDQEPTDTSRALGRPVRVAKFVDVVTGANHVQKEDTRKLRLHNAT